mmetsp:Transcript_72598/g.224263  ORF Transcript_72598/g.224263 Transcript_72598/m.224263 type:complete len:217 (+) Transcript_72598:423-1073(+)
MAAAMNFAPLRNCVMTAPMTSEHPALVLPSSSSGGQTLTAVLIRIPALAKNHSVSAICQVQKTISRLFSGARRGVSRRPSAALAVAGSVAGAGRAARRRVSPHTSTLGGGVTFGQKREIWPAASGNVAKVSMRKARTTVHSVLGRAAPGHKIAVLAKKAVAAEVAPIAPAMLMRQPSLLSGFCSAFGQLSVASAMTLPAWTSFQAARLRLVTHSAI